MLALLLFLNPEGATPAEAISEGIQRAATQLCINSPNSSRSIGLPVSGLTNKSIRGMVLDIAMAESFASADAYNV
jgi:hypothetical protein